MKELISITPDSKSFVANGTEYFIERTISSDRYREYMDIEIQLGFGYNAYDLFQQIKEAYSVIGDNPITSLTPNHIVQFQVTLYRLMEGVGKVADRELEVLRLCALFINTKDEDRRYYSKDIEEKKIHDWKEAGIDVSSFFLLASTFSESIQRLYKLSSESFSQEESENLK